MPQARETRSSSGRSASAKPIVQSGARMVRLLHLLLRAPAGARLSDLSVEIALPKPTVLRLLQTLASEGLVIKDPASGFYRMTSLFWLAIAVSFPEVRLVQQEIQEALELLARQSSATALLTIPSIGRRLMAASASALPDHPLIVHPSKEAWAPMHATASGKCYLAGLPPSVLHEWLKGELLAITEHTITSPEVLLREIQQVRERGYALHREEVAPGCWGMAVPILDSTRAVIAGLQLSAPLTLMTPENVQRWLPLLQRGAAKLSALLASGPLRAADGAPAHPAARRTPPPAPARH